MLRIHHATAKRAENLGLVLAVFEKAGVEFVQGFWPQLNRTLVHTDPKLLVDGFETYKLIALEYPKLDVAYNYGDDAWTVSLGDDELASADTLKEAWAEVLEQVEDGLDIEGESEELDEEDEEPKGNVVPARYREEYAARGNPRNCGDWLAQWLEGTFTARDAATNTEYFDHVAFTAMIVANGVDTIGKWFLLPASGQQGWKGRFRMNGRQKLEKSIARTKKLFDHSGAEVRVPEEFIEELWKKHPDDELSYWEANPPKA